MDFNDRTPPPTPLQQLLSEHARAISGQFPTLPAVPAVQAPPPPPPENPMVKWWKELTMICTGLATIGAVVWGISSRFFVTRDEWTRQNETILNINNQIHALEKASTDQATAVKEIATTTRDIQGKVWSIEWSTRGGARRSPTTGRTTPPTPPSPPASDTSPTPPSAPTTR